LWDSFSGSTWINLKPLTGLSSVGGTIGGTVDPNGTGGGAAIGTYTFPAGVTSGKFLVLTTWETPASGQFQIPCFTAFTNCSVSTNVMSVNGLALKLVSWCSSGATADTPFSQTYGNWTSYCFITVTGASAVAELSILTPGSIIFGAGGVRASNLLVLQVDPAFSN